MSHEKVIGMKFTDTAFWNADINDHRGGYQGRFVVIHEGREQEAESLMLAFKSAGGHGTKVRDGVVGLTEKQISDRITQLSGIAGREDIVDELNRGLQHVQHAHAKRELGETGPATITAKAKTGLVA